MTVMWIARIWCCIAIPSVIALNIAAVKLNMDRTESTRQFCAKLDEISKTGPIKIWCVK